MLLSGKFKINLDLSLEGVNINWEDLDELSKDKILNNLKENISNTEFSIDEANLSPACKEKLHIGDKIKMSFYDGSLNRGLAKKLIVNSKKPLRYTYGYTWKHPTTYKVHISTEEALKMIDNESYLDINENDEYIHLNAFSENDMF